MQCKSADFCWDVVGSRATSHSTARQGLPWQFGSLDRAHVQPANGEEVQVRQCATRIGAHLSKQQTQCIAGGQADWIVSERADRTEPAQQGSASVRRRGAADADLEPQSVEATANNHLRGAQTRILNPALKSEKPSIASWQPRALLLYRGPKIARASSRDVQIASIDVEHAGFAQMSDHDLIWLGDHVSRLAMF